MAEDRLRLWETLFERALMLIDSIARIAPPIENWTFGGGTVLMRRYRHRFSKDVDIFIADPQYLGFLVPRLNPIAESMTMDFIEDARFVKLRFPEGEIDFVVSAPLTREPTLRETLFGREVAVETSAEIIAKKLWHRGREFKARDMLDLALVAEREPRALRSIAPVIRDRRDVVRARIISSEARLRQDFSELDLLDYRPSFDQCLERVSHVLDSA